MTAVIAVVIAVACLVGWLIVRWYNKARVLQREIALAPSVKVKDAEALAQRLDKLVENLQAVGDEGKQIRDEFRGRNAP